MRNIPHCVLALSLSVLFAACSSTPPTPPAGIGRTVAFDDAFRTLVPADARIEKLVEGFTWSEGPTWVQPGGYLLLTDPPNNTMYRWTRKDGLSVLMKPSGYAGSADLAVLREAGANGLSANANGSVLLADSGTRAVFRLDPATKTKTLLADRFDGKRFNSPNDVVGHSGGAVFFTDPPYGLKGIEKSPAKEIPFSGIYRIDPDGKVALLDDSMSLPNGIALSPDERTLYVANSDPARPVWMAFSLDEKGNVTGKREFASAADIVGDANPGLPDGIAVAADGTLFATGPGGVLVLDPQGKRLGRIETGTAVANVAFGDDGRTLYMASHSFLARVRVNARGVEFGR